MAKQNVEEFLYNLLSEYGCKGVKVDRESIVCQCPFHHPRHNFKTFRASTVEVKHKRTGITNYYFNCFSCGESGTIPKLIAHINRCSFKKATRLFEKRVVLSPVTLEGIKKELNLFAVDSEDILPEISLPPISKNQKPMLKYLNKRNRTYHSTLDIPYIIKKYELYYCATGRYSGRIIMPIRDEHGRVIGFNDRTIDKTVKQKSLHKGGDEVSRMLHGLCQNKYKRDGIIVEGSFDMFAVDCVLVQNKQFGKDCGVVNLMGLVMSDDRLSLLLQYFNKLYLMFDHDDKGVEKTNGFIREYKDDVEFINCTEALPKHKDPAICTSKQIIKALKKPVIKKRKSHFDYVLEKSGFRI